MKEAKRRGRMLLRPLVDLLMRVGVRANHITLASVPLGLGAGILLATGRFFWGGVGTALVGVMDTLDGELSRRAGTSSGAGAFLDSTADRLVEVFALGGVYWHYRVEHPLWSALAVAAMVSSMLVSYVRARAEGAGYDCRVGLFERPIRVVVFLTGAVVPWHLAMPIALGIVAFGSAATVLHRIIHVVRQRGSHEA